MMQRLKSLINRDSTRNDNQAATAGSVVSTLTTNICRLILGVTFILSGFVKAIDPLGTQYKLADYIEAWGLSDYSAPPLTLTASVFLAALEFWLGICMLFAIRRRRTSVLMLLFMAVMTPLTLWLAITDPISDCGCFGDAVKLTNWQTFWKNMVLLVAAAVVCRRPLAMMRFVSKTNQWIVTNYSAVFIIAVSTWSLYDLPVFDFRPYHVGADIRKGMEIPEGAEMPKFEITLIYEKDGVTKEFGIDNCPDSTWTFIDSRSVMVEEGYTPPIHDFSIVRHDDGEDITGTVLDNPGYTFLLISPHLEKANDSNLDLINQIYEYADEQGYPFYCLTASGEKGIERWRIMTGAEYDFCMTDETTLKTMVRSNPGLILLKDGIIVNKWSHNRLPDEFALTGPLETNKLGKTDYDSTEGKTARMILWFAI
ncbi:MAG: BT_3928 family protein, partial [Prevotella sp.]